MFVILFYSIALFVVGVPLAAIAYGLSMALSLRAGNASAFRADLPLLLLVGLFGGGLVLAAGIPSVWSGWASWTFALVLWTAWPIFSYVRRLWSPNGSAWPTTPCHRSGTFLGGHWFEFEERPGARFWTRDPVYARQIRERSLPITTGGFDVVVPRHVDRRPAEHRTAILHALATTSTATLIALASPMLAIGLWAGLSGQVELPLRTEQLLYLAMTVGGLLGMGGLVMSLQVAAHATLFLVIWVIWNVVIRPTRRSATWTGTQLKRDGDRIDLDAPDLQAELSWGTFGTRLDVDNGEHRLRIRGEHRDLQPLHRAITSRETISTSERQAVLGRLQSAMTRER